ncbi:hypothetical protein KSP40_PGU018917 [Platanthera guangdongensis]|uniref:Uncharacterized protein n=1 Tax=Platanthera guangdongensis TaxID=2320717 RepID=A0ABR2MBG3_9ASPA
MFSVCPCSAALNTSRIKNLADLIVASSVCTDLSYVDTLLLVETKVLPPDLAEGHHSLWASVGLPTPLANFDQLDSEEP